MIKMLEVFLHNTLIGKISLLQGENTIFTFESDYINNLNREILSQSFITQTGQLITKIKPFRTRLDPFFSNLLPEGALRDYLAVKNQINPAKEFDFIEAVGADLPGAVVIKSPINMHQVEELRSNVKISAKKNMTYHFSLAGIQLKFSYNTKKHGGLTIPTQGIGGTWIVKLPSINFPQVPENEYAIMTLAKQIGINVPEFKLIDIRDISGLPLLGALQGNLAFAIQRFDRINSHQKIHIEDFAQVYGLYPEKKYSKVSYANMANMIWMLCGEQDLIEYIRRLVFSILIGNGDLHLKNWSFMYVNQRQTQLSPAYDLISTIPYIPEDNLALNLVNTKKMQLCNIQIFEKLIEKAKLPKYLVLSTVKQTVVATRDYWSDLKKNINLNSKIIAAIDRHMANIPL